ncbi:P-loop containing nucleoside triphosphate hydrolase protein [Phlebopus sp. FC_14]|nr:P-loop containing nucleoside triphosphate hydrolase protein [Phlebopus sp. FC_14]
MKRVFGINSFRLCQQGVCNANMDGRDVVCVMPTGGGKSLTYQLPALLTPGCTLVISPLISLITDQILHLREAGGNLLEAVMLTGGTSKSLANEIQQRLSSMASLRGNDQGEIKLCYVTPEKIAKSKGFMSLLRKLVEGGKLARIVIDEAHCVSQLGHDFRPDYRKLSVLRQFFPLVPILALSATCPPKVLQDILKILNMRPVVDGNSAPRDGTIYFSAPLYRKNLHYSVLQKPSSAKEVILTMAEYILQYHKNDSGIVYCLAKKDAETVAESLQTVSNGRIRTGVYHADIPDGQKETLHRQWREGSVQVVCATIAFGLGIDKGNVRFVLHHTKSLDGYYQESGRAGRDGQDADCVLYYRPQDATRQSAITCTDVDGRAKLHEMLRFAQDIEECRKILFAKYFSASSDLSMASWTTEESSAMDRCGHCDNCTRGPETIERKDVTLEAWQLLKILKAVDAQGGRQTIAGLSDLARGLSGGIFDAGGKGKRKKTKEKVQLDYDAVSGGKVGLSKDDLETLIVHLLVSRYLGEAYSSTAYTVNVYVIPGELALRLSRLTRADVTSGKGPRIQCSFKRRARKGKASAAAIAAEEKRPLEKQSMFVRGLEGIAGPSHSHSRMHTLAPVLAKKTRLYSEIDEQEEVESELVEDIDEEVIEDFTNEMRGIDDQSSSDDEDGEGPDDRDWKYSLRTASSLRKRQRITSQEKGLNQYDIDHEVISISSD